ncbi:MAG: relaxase domain-containing protein [Actinomycetales bacterium]|nr:relaxase domain-containing protein [Actinomycetales bacterium]
MTLHKLTAGDGYLYLMRHVAKADADGVRAADAAGYYTTRGNPPGVWLGSGTEVLGLAASEVTAEQMRALFGAGLHPDAQRIITEYTRARAHSDMRDAQVRTLAQAAVRQAQLGRKFAEYKPLPPLSQRVTERVAALEEATGREATTQEIAGIRRAESRRAAGAVAGFDLVFSPVKSVALVWALDPRAQVREAIRMSHEAAMTETLTFLEAHAAHTRTGRDGLAQIDTHGLVAVAFTHYDSRAGDPNLHTHLVISNKVQGVDGIWRALDARGLHALAVAASEHYNTRLQAHVTHRLGARFAARPAGRGKRDIMEIAGIDQRVIDHFSRRRAQLEARYDTLLAEYRATHGRDPDFAGARALAERANLETRSAKGTIRSLDQMRHAWRQELTDTFGPAALTALTEAVGPVPHPTDATAHATPPGLVPGSNDHTHLVEQLAGRVLDVVQNERSTWTTWNLRAETERALRHPGLLAEHHLHAVSAAELDRLAEAVVQRTSGPGMSLRIDPPALVAEPADLRRADGDSVFTRHSATRYTSQAVLDAEHRLLTAATTPRRVRDGGLTPDQVDAVLASWQQDSGTTLDAGQAGLVSVFTTDPRDIVVGLGPAGTGKTTAMRALKAILDHTGTGRLIPLATSAHAAAVLASELGARAENVHKFLHDHTTAHPGRITLAAGDVILVDEAGMAGTPNLDHILTLAQRAGARVRLLGDDRQLAAVESGGALRLLVAEAGVVELDVIHRFTNPDEATATLGLRTGDHRALAFYQQHDRIHGGSQQEMTDAAYAAWLIDVTAGKTSVLATTTTADVTRLAARARADRVASGHVEADGVLLHDGNTAGVGDWIVTRANDRRLTSPDRRTWVRNGDAWRVIHRRDDGALTVEHLRDGARVVLPGAYVGAHVELLYATTAHRVQGATVDTAHALITGEAAREHLYVLATRARSGTHLYVQTHAVLPVDEDERVDRRSWDPAGVDATVILQRILDREAAETSATQAITNAYNTAASLATLVPRYEHAITTFSTGYYERVLDECLDSLDAACARTDDAYPNLLTELRRAHQAGWQPERALADALRQARIDHASQCGPGELDAPARESDTLDTAGGGAVSMTRRLTTHLRRLTATTTPSVHLEKPTREDLTRYRALLTDAGIDTEHLDLDAALTAPALLRSGVFTDPVPGRVRAQITSTTYQQEVARALPRALAHRVLDTRANPTVWTTLQQVLARIEAAGHDIPAILSTPALRTTPAVLDAAQRLAETLTRFSIEHPTPALHGPNARTRAGQTYAFTHLAWAMKAAETHGHDPAVLLPDAAQQQARSGIPGVVSAWLHAQNQHANLTRPPAPAPVLPWAPDVVPATLEDPEHVRYLDQMRQAITDRVAYLRTDLEVAIGEQAPPAWTENLFTPAEGHEHARSHWLDHAQVLAAYRDQYPPATQDPDQPLGPHPEPAPHANHAHVRAHTGAAHVLALTWQIAHPHGTSLQVPAPPASGEEHVRRHMAIVAWNALDSATKTRVAATVLGRIGTLPTPTSGPDALPQQVIPLLAIDVCQEGLDEALTQPHTLTALHRALIDHGHLTDPDTRGAPNITPTHRRPAPATTRTSRTQPRGTPQRQNPPPAPRPDAPQPDVHRRYDPQPGRIEQSHPGRQHRW